MKVGILGTGDVAQAVGPFGSSGTFAETAALGEIVVLSTLATAYESVLAAAGPQHFKGKVVIDNTNPLDFSNGMPPSLAVGHNDSAGPVLETARVPVYYLGALQRRDRRPEPRLQDFARVAGGALEPGSV